MEQQIRVELRPRMVPRTSADAHKSALAVGNALQDLNVAKAAGGPDDIKRAQADYDKAAEANEAETAQDGWLASINGAEVQVVTYGIEPAAEGAQALVSLLIAADSLSVGVPAEGTSQTATSTASEVGLNIHVGGEIGGDAVLDKLREEVQRSYRGNVGEAFA